tara:strand:- start:1008 stop:1874 length:867 start_codon:yes stop_codon:yes gene_type:complete
MNKFVDNVELFEYTSAAEPISDLIKPEIFDFSKLDIKENNVNDIYQSPNLKIKYINVTSLISVCNSRASSNIFYVLDGEGTILFGDENIHFKNGDIITLPFYSEFKIKSLSANLVWGNDEALNDYLGVIPNKKRFTPTIYCNKMLTDFVKKANDDENSLKRNRNGVLLSNKQMVSENINTLTHTMWSLLNVIGPNIVQKPHRHNSIAIDLCISADDNKVYTLMSKELNDDGTVKNPIKRYWKKNSIFITPPGWWHSHHNESENEAWVFPIQDAGLYTYLNTLDIKFVN